MGDVRQTINFKGYLENVNMSGEKMNIMITNYEQNKPDPGDKETEKNQRKKFLSWP